MIKGNDTARMSRKTLVAVIISVLCLLLMTGCNETKTDQEHSPKVIEMDTQAITEDGQLYVLADLVFDKAVKYDQDAGSELLIKLGGKTVSDGNIEALQEPSGASDIVHDYKDIGEDHVCHLKIRADSTVNGILEVKQGEKVISFRHITDETGEYSIKTMHVFKAISSGAEISMNSTGPGRLSLSVTDAADESDVLLIKLRNDDTDTTLEPDEGTYDKLVDKAVIIENKDYANATTASTAKEIADAINQCYGSRMKGTFSGSDVAVSVLDKSDEAHYSLEIYEY